MRGQQFGQLEPFLAIVGSQDDHTLVCMHQTDYLVAGHEMESRARRLDTSG